MFNKVIFFVRMYMFIKFILFFYVFVFKFIYNLNKRTGYRRIY